jgi:hypothetical protein
MLLWPYQKLYQQFGAVYENVFRSHQNISNMVVTTRSNGRIARPRRHALELEAYPNPPLEGQNDPPPPPLFPPLGDVEQS